MLKPIYATHFVSPACANSSGGAREHESVQCIPRHIAVRVAQPHEVFTQRHVVTLVTHIAKIPEHVVNDVIDLYNSILCEIP